MSQDLSLLTHLTLEDIAHLQSVGKEAQQAQKEFILRDDQEAVWSHLKGLKGERIDFVLDNGKQFAQILSEYHSNKSFSSWFRGERTSVRVN